MIAVAGLSLLLASQYPAMAPLERYLMPRDTEVALARSAAPATISDKATILVLTRKGYETAVAGTNGFTCVVERGWTKSFDDGEFWNPKALPPICYNPQASTTVLRYTLFRTQQVLAGASEAQVHARLEAAIAANRLPQAGFGAMSYMLSKQQYINDGSKAWHPHIMIYTPRAVGAGGGVDWGANVTHSPVVYDTGHHANPEPWTLFFVPVARWSDGTPGPPL